MKVNEKQKSWVSNEEQKKKKEKWQAHDNPLSQSKYTKEKGKK